MNYGDKLLLILSGIVVLVSGYFFQKKDSYLQEVDKGPSIGMIKEFTNVLKQKGANSIAWEDATKGQQVFKDDQLFTYADSSAAVQLEDDIIINLAPNSLIKLGHTESGVDLNIVKGLSTVEFVEDKTPSKVKKKRKRKRKLTISMGAKKVAVSAAAAKFQISSQQKETKLVLVKGKAKVETGKKEVAIKKGEMLQADEKTEDIVITQQEIMPLTPLSDEVIYYSNVSDVKFTWDCTEPSDQFEIIVSNDPQFKKSIKKIPTKEKRARITKLTSGTYYWKIRSKVKKKWTDGPILSFKLKQVRAPRLMLPIDQAEIITALQRSKVQLSWEERTVESYEIEFVQGHLTSKQFQKLHLFEHDEANQDIEKRIKFFETEESNITLKDLPSGRYSWRVRSFDPQTPRSPWSAPFHFTLKEQAKFNLVYPTAGEIFRLNEPDSFVEFEWESQPGLEYEITISLDPTFEKVLIKKTGEGKTFLWRTPVPGKFYWKISFLDSNIISPPKSMFQVLVQLTKPLSPQLNTSIFMKDDQQSVKFKWQPLLPQTIIKHPNFSYILEVSRKSDFSKILTTRKGQKTEYDLKFPKIGKFYWRVRAKGINKYYRPSKTFMFETSRPPLPQPPKIKDKYRMQLKEDVAYLSRPTKASRSIASRDLFKNAYIEIKWPEVKEVKGYIFEIYKDKGLKKRLIRRPLKETKFKWKGVYPATYYLRIASVDFWDRMGPFSNVARLEVTIPKSAAELDEPDDGDDIAWDFDPIEFYWDAVKYSKGYLFELASDKGFSNILYSKKTTDTEVFVRPKTAATKDIKEGKYYWRVKTAFPVGSSKTSKPRLIEFEDRIDFRKQLTASAFIFTTSMSEAVSTSTAESSSMTDYGLQAGYTIDLSFYARNRFALATSFTLKPVLATVNVSYSPAWAFQHMQTYQKFSFWGISPVVAFKYESYGVLSFKQGQVTAASNKAMLLGVGLQRDWIIKNRLLDTRFEFYRTLTYSSDVQEAASTATGSQIVFDIAYNVWKKFHLGYTFLNTSVSSESYILTSTINHIGLRYKF